MWKIVFTKNAEKDKTLLKRAGLESKTKKILIAMLDNPFINPPSYEKLTGELKDYYSRRINYQHRIVYSVDKETKTIIVSAMWTHYE